MYKFSLTVRAYWESRRYNCLPSFEEWGELSEEAMRQACLKAGEAVFTHGRGKRTAVELYRAGGLGVCNIHNIMLGEVDFDLIRKWCESYDHSLHEALY